MENKETQPESKMEMMDDNARKFIISNIDQEFLKKRAAVSYTLVMDWIGIDPDDDRKIVCKTFTDGQSQILLVSKITKNGNRQVEKKPITQEEYQELLKSSRTHVEKKRFEINFTQDGQSFLLKYDEIKNSQLCLLEVDAPTAEVRASFDPKKFPYLLSEVTGNSQYYASRITEVI